MGEVLRCVGRFPSMHIGRLSVVAVFVLCCFLTASSAVRFPFKVPQVEALWREKPVSHQLGTPVSTRIASMKLRSGSIAASKGPASDDQNQNAFSVRKTVLRNTLGVWGVVQVVSILVNAIKRLYPIAAQPFAQKDMLPYQWGLYIAWSLYMAYAEGYKAFQLKFSPMVVQRAFSIGSQPTILNCLLAGPYSMGLFGASRKRMIVSWCITAGVFSLVKVVKMLPYPYRSIVDAGVVVGLSWGTLSIVALAVKALFGGKVEAPGEEGSDGTAKGE